MEDIIHNVRCELYEAVWGGWSAQSHKDGNPWLLDWKASSNLQLQIVRDAGADGEATISVPIHRGTFSIGFAAGINKKATNSTTIDFDVLLSDFRNPNVHNCLHLALADNKKRRPKLLEGRLGLSDWISRSVLAFNNTNVIKTGLTYVVEFVITAGGSVTPSFNIINPTGERFTASITASGERADTHKLTVTFAKVAATDETQKQILENIKLLRKEVADLNSKIQTKADNSTKLTSNSFDIQTQITKLSKINQEAQAQESGQMDFKIITKDAAADALRRRLEAAKEELRRLGVNIKVYQRPSKILELPGAAGLPSTKHEAEFYQGIAEEDVKLKQRILIRERAELTNLNSKLSAKAAAINALRASIPPVEVLPRTDFLQLRDAFQRGLQ